VSQVLNCSPFDSKLLNHTNSQLDFILENYAAENSDKFTFVRPGVETLSSSSEISAAWEKRLIGRARDSYLKPKLPSAAVFEAAKRLSQAGQILGGGAMIGANKLPRALSTEKSK
jgi:hypothetical protein